MRWPGRVLLEVTLNELQRHSDIILGEESDAEGWFVASTRRQWVPRMGSKLTLAD